MGRKKAAVQRPTQFPTLYLYLQTIPILKLWTAPSAQLPSGTLLDCVCPAIVLGGILHQSY